MSPEFNLLKELDSLFDFLNKHLISLKPGDMITICGDVLRTKYDVITSENFCVGLLLSSGFNIDRYKNIYYTKMYKVLILDKIILVKQSDIQEKI